MFVVIINYIKPIEAVDALLPAHREFLDQAYQEGVFLCSGARVPRFGGVILAKEKNREALLQRLHQDPFYLQGVAEYQVIEFTPTKFAAGFEILDAGQIKDHERS